MSSAAPKKSARLCQGRQPQGNLDWAGKMKDRRLGNQPATKRQPPVARLATSSGLFSSQREEKTGKEMGEPTDTGAAPTGAGPWSHLNSEPGRLVIDNAPAYPPLWG